MGEEFVNEEPATESGGLRSLRMETSLVAKPVKGDEGRSLVGLREHEVSARFNSPAVPSSAPSEVGTGKLALAQEEFVSYSVVQKRLMPSPGCHAGKMRNEKGGLGSNTHQRSMLPIFPPSLRLHHSTHPEVPALSRYYR